MESNIPFTPAMPPELTFSQAPDSRQLGTAADFSHDIFIESGQIDPNFALESTPTENYDWSHINFAINEFPESEVAGELESLAVRSIFSTPPLDLANQATPDTATSQSNASASGRITTAKYDNETRTGFDGASGAENRLASGQFAQATHQLKQLPRQEQQAHGVVMGSGVPSNTPMSKTTSAMENYHPVYAMHCSPRQTCFSWPPKKGPDGRMEDERVMGPMMPQPSQHQIQHMQQPRPEIQLPPELQKHVIPYIPEKHGSNVVQRRHSSGSQPLAPQAQQVQQGQRPLATGNVQYYQGQNQQQPFPPSYPQPYARSYAQNQQPGRPQFCPRPVQNDQQLNNQQFSYPQHFVPNQSAGGFQQTQNPPIIQQQRRDLQPSGSGFQPTQSPPIIQQQRRDLQPSGMVRDQQQVAQPARPATQTTQHATRTTQPGVGQQANWPIRNPCDAPNDPTPLFTAEGHKSQRKEKPSSRTTRPWDGSPNHCGTTWNMEQIYPDLMSNGGSANHIKPVAKCDILMGQSSQRAIQEAIQAGFFRGAEWLFRLVVEHMNKELRQHNTMLGFPPRKKDSKIHEIKKALVDQIIRNNPPMVAAAMSAQAIGWSFDEYYPGVFFQEDASGTVRDSDAILEAWSKLREDVVPGQLQPVIFETSTGLMVQTDKQPPGPPVADVSKVIKAATPNIGKEPTIKMAQFPSPNQGSSAVAAGGESFFTQPQGPYSMAKVMQKQREQREECDKTQITEAQLRERTTAERKRSERQWKKSEKQGWMLTGRKKETWFGGNKTVLWQCTDGEYRDLTEEVLKSVMERTRQMENRQRAKTMATAADPSTEAEGATHDSQALEMGPSPEGPTEKKAEEDQGDQSTRKNGEEEASMVKDSYDEMEFVAAGTVHGQNGGLCAEMEIFDFDSLLQSDYPAPESPSLLKRSASEQLERSKKRRMPDAQSTCRGRKNGRPGGQGSGLRQPSFGEQMLYTPHDDCRF